ncbi:uncharacterized protein LOC113021315 isoform X1 [Astatotilapia calliptera]|uniref:uncharacterized protein LOC113021315 isoform X1 n=1 Tax=Astatotilapia calliptera TaxID=8154 RepID=UPI000E401CB6|nr:uncharacterized protein LOC113021315 isoform X1 [Astatotilapia calliptera]XP_026021700.1 uncharacterized protein LOC113021315 isoform X1 [Astatotilapia calliptera]
MADEFTLTHKTIFSAAVSQNIRVGQERKIKSPKIGLKDRQEDGVNRDCFYCREPGHLIAGCPALRRKEQRKGSKNPAGVGLIKVVPLPKSHSTLTRDLHHADVEIEPRFEPFITKGFVSVTGEERDKVPVTILRDTGAHQSFMLDSVLPLSDKTACDSDVLVWGIKMSVLRAPLHKVHLHSPVKPGHVKVAVSSQLPIKGVSFILGNDLAGGTVFPPPEVVEMPVPSVTDAATPLSSVFPVCAITRAQSRKFDDVVDVADMFRATLDERKSPSRESGRIGSGNDVTKLMPELDEKLNRDALTTAQQNDSSLAPCFLSAAKSAGSESPTSYFVQDGVLMRRWSSDRCGLPGATQVVVPKPHRGQVLSLAHDASMAGHLGVNKTYHRVLRNFFWPGLKADVVAYCRTCSTCQMAGKPNRPIPPAPLHPIPVIGEPFEKVILDCVGPLPKTKSGHQYILTIMCSATRFPEAIPLRTLKAKPVIKAQT